jgi:hypothetical protein
MGLGGSRGGKGLTQGEQPLGGRGSDAAIRMMAVRRASDAFFGLRFPRELSEGRLGR